MAWTNPGALRPWYQDNNGTMLTPEQQAAKKTSWQGQQGQRQQGYANAQNQAQQWRNEGWQNPYAGPESGWNTGYTAPQNTDPTIAGVQGSGMTSGQYGQPQGMPSYNAGTTNATQGWTSPPVDQNSATAQNPYLNLGLNAFANTQQGFDTSWLDNLSKSLYGQANQNYFDNLKPTLDSSSISAGGYGGDRAALAQGVVMDRMNQNVMNAMAPQYANAYESSLNRALAGGQYAAGVGQNLEQLDINRLFNAGSLGIQQQNADTNTGQLAANSAGVPTYTNPVGAGVGGALSIAQILKMIFGED
jgi:hypothetical protein